MRLLCGVGCFVESKVGDKSELDGLCAELERKVAIKTSITWVYTIMKTNYFLFSHLSM